jgi:hypothetical protein
MVLNLKTDWWILKEWKIVGLVKFWDLNTILSYADCYKNIGLGVYESSIANSCRNYTYGSLPLILLSTFRIGASQTAIVGYSLILGFVLVTTAIAVKLRLNLRNLFFLLFTLISPPILLLLERGNLDILVFLLVVASSYCLSQGKKHFALFLLILGSLLKFYTFPLLLLFLLYNFNEKHFRLSHITPVLICFFWLIRDLLSVEARYIEMNAASFGVSIPSVVFLDEDPGSLRVKFLSSLVFFLIVFLVFQKFPTLISVETQQARMKHHFFELVLFMACSLIHVMVFSIALNFSYRLVYLIFAVLLLSHIIDRRFRKFIFCLKTLLITGVWFSFNVGRFEIIGQLSIYILTILLTVVIFQFAIIKLRSDKNIETTKS